jgi:hypothetical protein
MMRKMPADRSGTSRDSCDTIVALGDCTMSGNTLFAKNSDRPVHEAQPLELHARTMISVLSDHWLDDDVSSVFNPFPGEIRSVCMHRSATTNRVRRRAWLLICV